MLLLRPHGFTQGDYERLNAVATEEAAQQILDLVGREVVVALPVEGDLVPTFAIAPKAEEIRLFLNDRIPQLQNYLRDRPSLANSDYRALFGVDRNRALRQLRRLVELGVLVEIGVGRGTRYKAAEHVGERPL